MIFPFREHVTTKTSDVAELLQEIVIVLENMEAFTFGCIKKIVTKFAEVTSSQMHQLTLSHNMEAQRCQTKTPHFVNRAPTESPHVLLQGREQAVRQLDRQIADIHPKAEVVSRHIQGSSESEL